MRLTAHRELPQFATVGQTLHYWVLVKNHSQKLEQSLSLRDNLKQELPSFKTFLQAKEPGHKKRNWFDNYVGYPRWLWLMQLSRGAEITEQTLPPIPPGDIEIKMTLIPKRRGYVHFEKITFARPDPFGLFNAFYNFDKPDSLLILPKRYPVGEISLSGTRKYQRGGVQLAISVGDAEEFVSLREYRPGDPLRHIHWKSVAKMGKPLVKEYQDEFFVRHALILDTFTEQPFGELFETAVSVASSFASAPRSQDVLLDLMFAGTQAYCFSSGRGLGQTDKLLEILACVQACTDKDFQCLYPLLMEHLGSLSGCVCILLNWNDERQNFVQLLQKSGIPLLVVVISDIELEMEQTDVHIVHPNAITEDLSNILGNPKT